MAFLVFLSFTVVFYYQLWLGIFCHSWLWRTLQQPSSWLSWMETCVAKRWVAILWRSCVSRSALVNIRRKALSSSVGFRKRMTSRSPRGSLRDSCKLRFDRPLWFVWWSDVCFDVLSCFFDHPSIDSTKKIPLHLFGKDVLMFPLESLLAHQEGPFSRCYWVTSLEWLRIEWHSWGITRTRK